MQTSQQDNERPYSDIFTPRAYRTDKKYHQNLSFDKKAYYAILRFQKNINKHKYTTAIELQGLKDNKSISYITRTLINNGHNDLALETTLDYFSEHPVLDYFSYEFSPHSDIDPLTYSIYNVVQETTRVVMSYYLHLLTIDKPFIRVTANKCSDDIFYEDYLNITNFIENGDQDQIIKRSDQDSYKGLEYKTGSFITKLLNDLKNPAIYQNSSTINMINKQQEELAKIEAGNYDYDYNYDYELVINSNDKTKLLSDWLFQKNLSFSKKNLREEKDRILSLVKRYEKKHLAQQGITEKDVVKKFNILEKLDEYLSNTTHMEEKDILELLEVLAMYEQQYLENSSETSSNSSEKNSSVAKTSNNYPPKGYLSISEKISSYFLYVKHTNNISALVNIKSCKELYNQSIDQYFYPHAAAIIKSKVEKDEGGKDDLIKQSNLAFAIFNQTISHISENFLSLFYINSFLNVKEQYLDQYKDPRHVARPYDLCPKIVYLKMKNVIRASQAYKIVKQLKNIDLNFDSNNSNFIYDEKTNNYLEENNSIYNIHKEEEKKDLKREDEYNKFWREGKYDRYWGEDMKNEENIKEDMENEESIEEDMENEESIEEDMENEESIEEDMENEEDKHSRFNFFAIQYGDELKYMSSMKNDNKCDIREEISNFLQINEEVKRCFIKVIDKNVYGLIIPYLFKNFKYIDCHVPTYLNVLGFKISQNLNNYLYPKLDFIVDNDKKISFVAKYEERKQNDQSIAYKK